MGGFKDHSRSNLKRIDEKTNRIDAFSHCASTRSVCHFKIKKLTVFIPLKN